MEKDRILKSREVGVENFENKPLDKADAKVVETLEDVAKGVNLLNEDAESLGMGNVSEEDEDNGKKPGENFAGGAVTSAGVKASKVKALPPVEVMIQETAKAIEAELERMVEENERMRKSKKYSNSQLNESVKQIRHLNGLLMVLKNAAKLAEDFIIGLWKQFVKKA
ncbi:MAG: hypothetical protein ACRCZE_04365 [Candidatus Altimarinota bacterium]